MSGAAGAADVMAVDVNVSGNGALNAGVPRKLFSAAPVGVITDRNTWDVTPDAQRFLINSTQQGQTASVPPLTVILNWASNARK